MLMKPFYSEVIFNHFDPEQANAKPCMQASYILDLTPKPTFFSHTPSPHRSPVQKKKKKKKTKKKHGPLLEHVRKRHTHEQTSTLSKEMAQVKILVTRAGILVWP
ncbi:hypothetical protein PoB_003245500 [Plakobranchus ocellatus]|uniref:Uncharacterized protein n=1 Tax=Plakobranchus ocellatus TaxID=259542 RepID=A0AAV4ACQ4_9GAST|nr:hypothetical protein PoB_003245500 [Plakobranchus ocellatus]